MKEFELYVPLRSKEGKRVSAGWLNRLKQRLTEQFGGLTHFPQRGIGLWKSGRITLRDEIVILRVLAKDTPAERRFWQRLKANLKRDLKQSDILLVRRTVTKV